MKKFGMGCVYGFAMIGGLVVVCAVLALVAGSRQNAAGVQTGAAASQTAQRQPTMVPTSVPFAEQIATTRRSQVSPDLAAYLLRAAKPADHYGKALNQLGAQAKRAGEQPKLLRDPQWQREALAMLSQLKAAGRELQNIQPVPPEAQRLDRILDNISTETEAMTTEYAAVVERQDLKALGSASRRLGRVAELISEAGQELQRLSRAN